MMLGVISLIFGIIAASLLFDIFLLILARFFLSKVSKYKLFFLLIDFTKGNIAFVLAIKKLFVLCKMLQKIV